MDPLQFLQAWYHSNANSNANANADGHWERSHGVTIESLDNPGWLVTIDLEGTPLEKRAMPPVAMEVSKRDWLLCEVDHNRFRGQGDPEKLLPILQVFQTWAETFSDASATAESPR
jgi:hypothetical protein